MILIFWYLNPECCPTFTCFFVLLKFDLSNPTLHCLVTLMVRHFFESAIISSLNGHKSSATHCLQLSVGAECFGNTVLLISYAHSIEKYIFFDRRLLSIVNQVTKQLNFSFQYLNPQCFPILIWFCFWCYYSSIYNYKIKYN